MLSFRQKIFLTYIAVFLLFIALLFPFASRTVQRIVFKGMRDRAEELILKIQSAPNDEALLRRLKELKPLIFFRISVITNDRKVLYDSHTKRLLGPRFSQEYVVGHPEVLQAFREGIGYHEDYSDLLGQKFSYMALAFDFHGKKYILRTAFPYKYVSELTRDFEIGFLLFAIAVLLPFSFMSWFIINYLSRPIGEITEALRPYQQGISNTVPQITLSSANRKDEFGKLAETLNSLSEKIRNQISTLTRERNEKESILESLVEGVIAVDSQMRMQYANQAALKLLDLPHESLLNQPIDTIPQPGFPPLLSACLKEKKPLTDTAEIKAKNSKVYLDIVAAPMKDGSGALLVLEDKTPHRKILEMRKDFIANASHELKTPITVIKGFAETMHDNPGLPEETLTEVTGKIVNNCNRMTELIKDLLTLTDIENLPLSRLAPCDLPAIIQHCTETIQNVHKDAKIHFEVEKNAPTEIIGDSSLLEMAFSNLIENAAKYSIPPADISITLDSFQGNVRIRIADKGIGIPAGDLEHIFERFYTVNKARSRKLGGSGLGLSLVETIIHKHFGKISAESAVNVGTTFTILLPVDREGSTSVTSFVTEY